MMLKPILAIFAWSVLMAQTKIDLRSQARNVTMLTDVQSGVFFTWANADCGKFLTRSNSSAMSDTLPQAGAGGQFLNGCAVHVQNTGASPLTITATSSTFTRPDGTVGSSLVLLPGEGKLVVSDGVNYRVWSGFGTGGGGGGGGISLGGDIGGTLTTPRINSIYGQSISLAGPFATNGAGFGISLNALGSTSITLPPSGLLGHAGADTVPGASATPFFTCSSNTINRFRYQLSATVVTSSSTNACTDGMTIIMQICQDSIGNRPFPFPSTMTSGPFPAAPINLDANSCTTEVFSMGPSVADLWFASTNSGSASQPEITRPTVSPVPGQSKSYINAATHLAESLDTFGVLHLYGLAGPGTAFGTAIYTSPTSIGSTVPGTAGWVLTSNGPSAAPTYQAPAAGGGGTAKTFPITCSVGRDSGGTYLGGGLNGIAAPGANNAMVGDAPALGLDNGGSQYVVCHQRLADSYTSLNNAMISLTQSLGGGGSIIMSLQIACVANGGTLNPTTYNAAQTVTIGMPPANQRTDFVVASPTLTGCAATNDVFFKWQRLVGGFTGVTYVNMISANEVF